MFTFSLSFEAIKHGIAACKTKCLSKRKLFNRAGNQEKDINSKEGGIDMRMSCMGSILLSIIISIILTIIISLIFL